MKKTTGLTIIDSIDHETGTFYARWLGADAASGELVFTGRATDAEIREVANNELAAPDDDSDYSGYDVVWTDKPEVPPAKKIYLSAYTGYRHNRYDGYCSSWGVLMALGASPTADAFADEDDYPDDAFQTAYNGEDETIGNGDNDGFRSDVLQNLDDSDIEAVQELEPGETAEFSQFWGQYEIVIKITRAGDKLLCVFDGHGPFEVTL